MTEAKTPEVTEKDLPSLDLVYPLAIESYETARQRKITQDNRIQIILALTLAITGAIPAVYQIFGISPNMLFLIAAGVFFLLGTGFLLAALMRNSLKALTISTLHEHYISLPEIEAKENLIHYAGQADEENARYIETRWRFILFATFCLAAEVLALALSGLIRLS